jgi:hypothetical protein
MDILGEILIWSLANHEMPSRRKHTPEFSNIRISGLWNMFENAVGKNEYKLAIRKWKACGIRSVGEGDPGPGDCFTK